MPAAVAAAIDAEGSERVRGAVVVEAANLPSTAAAQARLALRAACASSPTSSPTPAPTAWFTWLATGEIRPEAASTFARLRALMAETVPLVLEQADAERVTTHEAAQQLAERRLAERWPPERQAAVDPRPDAGPEQPWRRGRARDCSGSDVAVDQETPSFSAAIFVPLTRLAIFWKATSRA